MTEVNIYEYAFQDAITNEIFSLKSSFAIPLDALKASPHYKLAILESIFRDRPPKDRFTFLGRVNGNITIVLGD